MKKNPSTDSMIVPSPLGALICILYEALLTYFVIISGNTFILTLFCMTDFSFLKLVVALLALHNNVDKRLIVFLSWGYQLSKRRKLCYIVIPGVRCCKDGGKIWHYELIKDG